MPAKTTAVAPGKRNMLYVHDDSHGVLPLRPRAGSLVPSESSRESTGLPHSVAPNRTKCLETQGGTLPNQSVYFWIRSTERIPSASVHTTSGGKWSDVTEGIFVFAETEGQTLRLDITAR